MQETSFDRLMKYQIADQLFKTKADITRKVRELLAPFKNSKSVIDGETREFLLDLLKHHDEWNFKTQQRPDEQLNLMFENMWYECSYPSHGLRIYFGDELYRGSEISWHHAIKMMDPNL